MRTLNWFLVSKEQTVLLLLLLLLLSYTDRQQCVSRNCLTFHRYVSRSCEKETSIPAQTAHFHKPAGHTVVALAAINASVSSFRQQNVIITLFFSHVVISPSGSGPPCYQGFTITLVRTPLDEWSARHRDLWQHTTLTTGRRPTPAGFEPEIPASEPPQTHDLDRAAIGIGSHLFFSSETQVRLYCAVILYYYYYYYYYMQI